MGYYLRGRRSEFDLDVADDVEVAVKIVDDVASCLYADGPYEMAVECIDWESGGLIGVNYCLAPFFANLHAIYTDSLNSIGICCSNLAYLRCKHTI